MRVSVAVSVASALLACTATVGGTIITERQSSGRTSALLTGVEGCVGVMTSPQSLTFLYSLAFPGQAALPTLTQLVNFNATNHTLLPLSNIQGDIL